MIERFIFLFFRFNINGGQFFNQIQKLVMANNIDRAIKLCNAADKAALARVIKAGLTRANKSEADIAAAVEEAMLEVAPAISKRVPMILGARKHRDPARSARNDLRHDRSVPCCRNGVRGPALCRSGKGHLDRD